MHHLDANKTLREQLKNTASRFEQILEATPHKTTSTATYLLPYKTFK